VSDSQLAELAESAGLRWPRALTLAITGSCNLRCRHCWVEAGLPGAAGHAPLGRALRIVDDFAALGGETIWLTGGEPLSHPDWPTILSHGLAQPSLRSVGIQTNGGLLDEANVSRLRALPAERLCIQVSLDGISPRTHDRVRGVGSFVRVMAGLSRLAAAGLGGRTSVAFTEMRHNMEDIPELLERVDRLGLRGVVGGTLVKDGRAARTKLEPPTPRQYRELLSRYHADARFRELYEKYGEFSAIEWWKGRLTAGGERCTFIDHPYVTAGGTIHPCRLCHADDFAIPGAFERPLRAALGEGIPRWSRLLQLSRVRSASLPQCQACEARLHCAGGCMGRAHAVHGSLAAVEDRCELRRAVASWHADEAGGVRALAPP
jgi:radical SAM protein with 4Fe4S-binding SPASM domain